MTARPQPSTQRLDQLTEAFKRDKIRREILISNRDKLLQDLDATRLLATRTEKARELLNTLVNHRKRTTLDKIESLVSHGLQTIFDNPNYKFAVEASTIRKQLTYSFKLSDGVHESSAIEESRGGGVINIVSFLLSVVIQLLLDKKARTFVLDESFSHVPVDRTPHVAELLQTLSSRMKLQFIVVTHQEALAEGADTVYHFTKGKDGAVTAHRRK